MLEVLELAFVQSVSVDECVPMEDNPLGLSTRFRPGLSDRSFLIKIKFPG